MSRCITPAEPACTDAILRSVISSSALKYMKPVFLLLTFFLTGYPISAQTYHALQGGPFQQNWTDTNLITVNNNWSNVPSVMGYRGDNLTLSTGVDPQTILADQTTVNVIANQTSPDFLSSGGVAEFHLPNPAVALQGSGTADAPFVVICLNTTGISGVRVKYKLRDLDGSANNAVQAVALQYRIGSSGNFTNLPAGFVADATTGPSQASLVTTVNVLLPPDCNNRSQLQVRIITANANGSDEWVGIDDVEVLAESQIPLPVSLSRFSGIRNELGLQLEWSTLTETANTGFTVEGSADGIIFTPLGFVNSRAPQGNSERPLHYLFHTDNAGDRTYFRIRQSDRNGQASYSLVIRIPLNTYRIWTIQRVYPMPFRDLLHVQLYAQQGIRIRYRLMDAAGRVLLNGNAILQAGQNELMMRTENWPAGWCILEIRDEKYLQPAVIRLWKE